MVAPAVDWVAAGDTFAAGVDHRPLPVAAARTVGAERHRVPHRVAAHTEGLEAAWVVARRTAVDLPVVGRRAAVRTMRRAVARMAGTAIGPVAYPVARRVAFSAADRAAPGPVRSATPDCAGRSRAASPVILPELTARSQVDCGIEYTDS